MLFHLEKSQAVLDELKSDFHGLSAQEAAIRLQKDGKNKLKAAEKTSLARRFINQILDPMIIILIIAAIVSAVVAVYENESFADVCIILFVVVLNAVLGVVQETKAEKAIEALKAMSSSTSTVLRDDDVIEIKSEDLVVGDIIILEAGDAVPADARIIECASMQAEEAALTGESLPVDKTTDALQNISGKEVPLGDRKNMVYMGSSIVYGRGKAVVTATGMNTEMGKLAAAISSAAEGKTPLQKKLAQLSKILTFVVLGICLFIFAFSMIKAGGISGDLMIDTFMLAVSLAVAAIPEGLVAVVTIVLSMGVTKMSKNNAIVRKLTAVETLGCTQIICSDKTGTLTQNKMSVAECFTHDPAFLGRVMGLCNDASVTDTGEVIGEPTEVALVNFGIPMGLVKEEMEAMLPRVDEIPFDSTRKLMTTIHDCSTSYVQYTKGAPDELLKLCTGYFKNGHAQKMTDEDREEIIRANQDFANKALRVLAGAYRWHVRQPSDNTPEELEHDLIFVGLVGMIDPVRPEVVEAIEKCKTAGIKPVMITGDHRDTAIAIAKQLDILEDPSQAITGTELNDMSDEQLYQNITNYSVYARVQPEHKVRIVQAWQKRNYITAMTGDGVNDAPAIKNADIGIGMGITGTDVTKNVADIVLADDNFATIVTAVEEGRRIYSNIQKTIQFLLASNLSEVIAIFIATIMGFTILNPVHILWINLITDCLPALALGMEKGEPDLMKRHPRSVSEGIFANGVGSGIAYQGVIVAALTLLAYFIGHYIESGIWEIANSPDGMTMAFLTLSMVEIFHSFNMRSLHGSVFNLSHQNMYLFASMAISMILTTGVIYIDPLATAFGFSHISLLEYCIAMGLAVSIIPIVEIVKLVQRISNKSNK